MSQREAKVEVAVVELPNPEISGMTAVTDVLHPSAAETAAFTSSDRDYSKYKSGTLYFNLSARTGGTGITFFVEGKDPLSGTYYTHHVSASLTTTPAFNWVAFDETTQAMATQQTNQTASIAHPLTGTTYRIRTQLDGAVTSYTFSAYIVLKPQ